jgi:hypothetical protein
MSHPDLQSSNTHTSWKILAEFLIPTTKEIEAQAMDHIADTLNQIGLEPGQMDQIISTIDHSLQNLEGSLAPLHLRISLSGFDLGEMQPEENLNRQRDVWLDESGFGFFLVKRIVGQSQDPDPAKRWLLEVLIYRESSQAKE